MIDEEPDAEEPQEASFGLACPFLNSDPVFAQGVAFGTLWSRMRDPECDEITEYILSEIEEQVRVAASRTGWNVIELKPWEHEGKETGWVFCRMVRREKYEAWKEAVA